MLVTISTYTFPYEAQIAWSKLDAEGIPAFIADEHTINMQWLYSNALGGVRLQVLEEHAELAKDVLNENLAEELLEKKNGDFTLCPACGSNDTEYFQFGRQWAFLVFLGINFPLFPVKHGIKCRHCGETTKNVKL